MTMYEFLLWLHVTFAALWVGGGLFFNVYATRVQSSGSREEIAALPGLVEWAGKFYYSPLAVLTLVFGTWLVIDGDWDFAGMWISLAYLVFIASLVISMGFLGPESRRITAAIQSGGTDGTEATSRLTRLLWVTRVDTLLLLFAVFLMTVKPGA